MITSHSITKVVDDPDLSISDKIDISPTTLQRSVQTNITTTITFTTAEILAALGISESSSI